MTLAFIVGGVADGADQSQSPIGVSSVNFTAQLSTKQCLNPVAGRFEILHDVVI